MKNGDTVDVSCCENDCEMNGVGVIVEIAQLGPSRCILVNINDKEVLYAEGEVQVRDNNPDQ